MNRITLKKYYGNPVSLLVSGPDATSFPGTFVNIFAPDKKEEAELPLVEDALKKALEWAHENNIEAKAHPTVQQYFERFQSNYEKAANFAWSLSYKSYPMWDKLYPHQQFGVKYILTNAAMHGGQARILLADDPRLGKSPLALAAIWMLKVHSPVLILCPKALIAQWCDYVKTWLPGRVPIPVTGSSDQKRTWLQVTADLPVYITNWETLRSVEEIFDVRWGAVIGDEAHKIKNRKSQVSQQLHKLDTAHIMLLSATFVENMPDDWWNPLNTIHPKYFTSYWRWVGNYVETRQGYNSLEFVGVKQPEIMRAQTKPYILQRRSDEVANMPEKLYERYVTNLEGDHLRFYKEIEDKARIVLTEGVRNLPNKVSAIMAMRQAAIHPALCDGQKWNNDPTGKLALLQELVADYVPQNEQVIVFSSFILGCMVAGYSVKDFGGAAVYAGPQASDDNVKKFQAGNVRTLCATPQKGGVGLNLFNANWIFFLDLPWSTIDIRQSEERVRAIGKKEPVTIVQLVAQNTIDEYVTEHVMNKLENAGESECLLHAEHWLLGE